jgi:hypothetical protein
MDQTPEFAALVSKLKLIIFDKNGRMDSRDGNIRYPKIRSYASTYFNFLLIGSQDYECLAAFIAQPFKDDKRRLGSLKLD